MKRNAWHLSTALGIRASTKAPTGEDLKFLREELEAAKWRFCPDVYGNGVYVFAREIVGDC